MGYSKVERARIDAGVCVGCGSEKAREGRRRCTYCAWELAENERQRLDKRRKPVRVGKLVLKHSTLNKMLANGRLSYSTVKRAQTK